MHNFRFSENYLYQQEGSIEFITGCYWDFTTETSLDFQRIVTLDNKLSALLSDPTVRYFTKETVCRDDTAAIV